MSKRNDSTKGCIIEGIVMFLLVILTMILMKLNWIATLGFLAGIMIGQIGEKLKWWDK